MTVHPVIQAYIDAGECVLYFDPRSGSYRDWSETGNDVTPTAPTRLSMLGANLNHTGRMDIAADPSLDLASYDSASVVMFMPDTYRVFEGAINYIWSQQSTGDYFGTNATGSNFILNLNGAISSYTSPPLSNVVGKKCYAFSWIDGSQPNFYTDGIYRAPGNLAPNKRAAQSLGISIGAVHTSYIRQIPSNFGAVLAFNRALTETEHALVYDALEHTTWPRLTYSHAPPKSLAVCDDPGIVAAYNMRPVGGKVYDLSASRNDATVVGPIYEKTPLGDALYVRNETDNIASTYIGQPAEFTFSGWFFVNSTGFNGSGRLFEKSANKLALYTSGATALTFRYGNPSQQNIVINDAYTQAVWQHLCVVRRGDDYEVYNSAELIQVVTDPNAVIDTDPLYIGCSAALARPMGGLCAHSKFFERALSEAEIKAEYNEGAKTLLYKTDWGARETAAPVTAGLVGGSPWEVISGSFDVVTVDIDGVEHKALKCVSDGAAAIPSSAFQVGPTQAARGSYRWKMYRAGTGVSPYFAFVSDVKNAIPGSFNGYYLRFFTVERVQVNTGAGAVLMSSGTGLYPAGSFYEFDIDFENDGTLTAYVDGELLDLTGGSGNNPAVDTSVTDSEYVVWGAVSGDMLVLGNRAGENGFQKLLGVPK